MLKHIAILTSVAVLSAACGGSGEEPAAVKQPASESTIIDSSSPSPTDETAPGAATLGDLVDVGAWDVRVTELTLNANDAVKAGDKNGYKPPRGQYVLVDYEATNTGNERTADPMADLHWTFTTTDQTIHEQEFVRTAAPAVMAGKPTSARKGGTIRYQALWDLPPDQIKGGILTVEGFDEDFQTVYADFVV
jgi:hypothetical protein